MRNLNPWAPFSRSVGSQAEVPKIVQRGEDIEVRGYQRYRIEALAQGGYRLESRRPRLPKVFRIESVAPGAFLGKRVMDLGCSSGLESIQATLYGAKSIVLVDHDPEYLALAEQLVSRVAEVEVEALQQSALEVEETADVVLAFALVHWLHAFSEETVSLSEIVERLLSRARDALFVEWVGPRDRSIRIGGHLRRTNNPNEYSEVAWINAMKASRARCRPLFMTGPHRQVWELRR